MTVAIVVLIIVAVAAFFIVKARNASAKPGTGFKAPTRRDPFADAVNEQQFWDLKAGDLVRYEGLDHFVRKTVMSQEGSYKWLEHLLDDGQGSRHWMTVEDDDGLDLGLWDNLDMVDIEHGGAPGDASVVTGGKAFKRKESGTAQYQFINSDETGSGQVDYFQYEAADKTMLAFQRYDGAEWSASLGLHHRPSEFDIFPASDPTSH